jgi:integral membrane sensor domain MASE1
MTGNMVESIGCALLILRMDDNFQKFGTVREVIALIAGVVLINAVSSCIGAGVSVLTSSALFMKSWQSWYISDGLGLLLVGPFIVSWSEKEKGLLSKLGIKKILEA